MFKKKKKKSIYLIVVIVSIINMLFNPLMIVFSYANSITNSSNNLFNGGLGTEESPYLISTPEQLKNMQNDFNASYKLINDIDLTYDTTNVNGLFYNDGLGWIPLDGEFSGTLDGNGKKIIGLHQERTIDESMIECIRTGLFQSIYNANIYDLDITDLKITYNVNGLYEYFSGLTIGSLGYKISNSEINSVNLNGEIKIVSNGVASSRLYTSAGGFAAYISNSNFTNCVNNINIKSDFYGNYAGFSANASSSNNLNSCVNNGSIQAVDKTTLKDYYVAGLIAWVDGYTNFTSCTNNGNLTGKSVAGIVCYDNSNGKIKFCNNYGELNIYAMNSGGIVATAVNLNIEECFNAGTLNIYASEAYDNANIGGIVGKIKYSNSNYTLKNIYNVGPINVYSSNINANIGGIVGYLKGDLQLCYNLGIVNLTKFDIDATYYASNSISPANSGTFIAGPIFGSADTTSHSFSNCYYLKETIPIIISGRSEIAMSKSFDDNPLTFNEMLLTTSFLGFDFNNIWNMSGSNNYDFPQLNNNLINGVSTESINESIKLNQTNVSLAKDEVIYKDVKLWLPPNTQEYTVIGPSNENLTSIVIPNEYNGIPITSIGLDKNLKCYFNDNNNIEKVIVGENIRSMWLSFNNCSNLKSISLPDGLLYLDDSFNNCTSLEKVEIPSNIVSLTGFQNCTALKQIKLPASSEYFKSYSSNYTGAFYGCDNVEKFILSKGNGKMFDFLISKPIVTGENIEYHKFLPWYTSKSTNKNIVIEEGVKNISKSAFLNCKGVKTIIIPNSVEKIEEDAFWGCDLQELTLPVSAKVTPGAFYGCNFLGKITFTKGTTGIMDYEFSYDTEKSERPWLDGENLREVIIEEGVKNIGFYSFYNCYNLEKIVLPNSIEKIEGMAFGDCELDYLKIPYKTRILEEYSIRSSDVKLLGVIKGSEAEEYAIKNNIPYEIYDTKGNLNGDGKANNKDWALMYQYINGTKEFTEEQMVYADVNNDGKVNNKDWNRLYYHINGTDLL